MAGVPVATILDALTRLPVVCPRTTLVETIGTNGAALDRSLWRGSALGLIEWCGLRPKCVALTPLSASRLGIEPSETGERWIPVGTVARWTEPPDLATTQNVLGGDRADDSPSPLDLLIAAESGGLPKDHSNLEQRIPLGDRVTVPVLILGLAHIWNGPLDPAEPCPVCRGNPLHGFTYCLLCDRCGIDPRLPLAAPGPLPASVPLFCPDDPGYVERNGVKVPERFSRMMKG